MLTKYTKACKITEMPIKVLAPDVVSRIAAGEVIERPASVVKELVENALDAGAIQISIEIQGGGVELIKVSDNGAGIPTPEVELAFHRYASSKISSLDDLEKITSLGFRGEALPSIAALAEVEVYTKATSEGIGSYAYLRQGDIVRRESHNRPQGTTVSVRYLFRYFPARLKFLKSRNTENSHIANVVSQYALAFPDVAFTLLLDKHLSLHTAGDGDLRQVISQMYGLEVAQKMIEVTESDALLEVIGLSSSPSLTRSDRSHLSFFVNRRWVHSALLTRATEEAYRGLLMDGKHPITIINLSLPAAEIDANVHPAKAQVKFHHEQIIFATVKKAIKAALDKTPVARPEAMVFSDASWEEIASLSWQRQGMVRDNESPYVTPPFHLKLPVLRVLGQLTSTYIIAEGPDGLYIVDQHAAHERILYDKILTQWSVKEVEAQGLLQPLTVELTPRENEILKVNKEKLNQFGFTIEPFGDRSYLIRSMPAVMTKTNITETVNALLDNLGGKENSATWEERAAQSLACHSAIRAGQELSYDEMRELIKQLEQCQQPRTCPHGRPTMIHISLHQLEKEFGRTG